MITDTIINNRDVYDEAIKDDEKKSKRLSTTSPSTDTPATPDKPNNDTSTVNNDPNAAMPTPSPSKRPHISPPACNIISPQPIISGSVMKGEFDLVQKAVGYNVDLLGNECDEHLDRLLTQLVALKQKKAADKIILCYKDYRNGKAASFVKNPVNKSDAAFVKLSAWIDKALVDHMHQITCRSRDQFRTTLGKEVRAIVMA